MINSPIHGVEGSVLVLSQSNFYLHDRVPQKALGGPVDRLSRGQLKWQLQWRGGKYTTSRKTYLFLKGWKCTSSDYHPTHSFSCSACLKGATVACTGMKNLTVPGFHKSQVILGLWEHHLEKFHKETLHNQDPWNNLSVYLRFPHTTKTRGLPLQLCLGLCASISSA